MTPMDLALKCKEAIENEDGDGCVVLELNRRAGGSSRVSLAGRGSPVGELLCENSNDRAVARFDAVSVLAWLCGKGLVSTRMTVRVER